MKCKKKKFAEKEQSIKNGGRNSGTSNTQFARDWSPWREKWGGGTKKILDEITAAKFPSLVKTVSRSPMNPKSEKQRKLRYIISKLSPPKS